MLLVAILLSLGARRSDAQITLADDIILAAQGKENASEKEQAKLGRTPGTQVSRYSRSPGSTDVVLGQDPNRRVAPLPPLAQRPANPAQLLTPESGQVQLGHGLAPAIETHRLPMALPSTEPSGPEARFRDDLGEDEGPPTGLTLDAAIERLVRFSPELQSKQLEIPQAQADVLTAGLRENPLLFYSTDEIPYGAYSKQRPGQINSGISIVLPIDFAGKRRARITVAESEKCVLEAQYQDAVRLAIDNLYTVYVDALAQQQAARTAERGLGLLDQLLAQARLKSPRGDADEDAIDDLTVERELAAMARDDQRERYLEAKLRLAELLGISHLEAESLQVHGSLRDLGPKPPACDDLITIALGQRPDLAAHRLGIARAQAELALERAERFSNAYFLYTPFEYRDNSQVGASNTTSWGAGVFVSAPLFNRNQGNLKKARINIDQSQIEARALEEMVITEVRRAFRELETTREDVQRLEQTALPALHRKSDRAWRKFHSGQISTEEFLAIQRDSTILVRYYRDTLARHRHNALKLNTAVGHRILP